MDTEFGFDFDSLDHTQYDDLPLMLHAGLDSSLPFSLLRVPFNTTKMHRHRYLQILYILHGAYRHKFLHWETDVEAGDLLLIPYFVPHSLRVLDKRERNMLYELEFPLEFLLDASIPAILETGLFDFSGLDPTAAQAPPPRAALPIRLRGEARQQAEELFAKIEEEYQNRFVRCGCLPLLRAWTVELLIFLHRHVESSREYKPAARESDRRRLAPALRRLNAEFDRPLDIGTLCRAAAMSPSAFRRAFRRLTGKSPVEYLHMLRVDSAMQMLLSQPTAPSRKSPSPADFRTPATSTVSSSA